MSLEKFFTDKDALMLVDGVAKRYGMTPFEVIACQTLYEFNFNVAVMLGAMNIEAEIQREAMENHPTGKSKDGKEEPLLRDFGIKRTVHKKVKD